MANETQLTVVGNLTAAPDLRFTPNGVAVANFTIASTPRTFDKQQGEMVDGDAIFMRCTVWREHAENVAESLDKGMQVMAQGRLKPVSWEKDGVKHSTFELDVDNVGPCLRFATAQVTKRSKGQGNRPPHPAEQQSSGWGQSTQQTQQATSGTDPWATDNRNPDEPPF